MKNVASLHIKIKFNPYFVQKTLHSKESCNQISRENFGLI